MAAVVELRQAGRQVPRAFVAQGACRHDFDVGPACADGLSASLERREGLPVPTDSLRRTL